MQLVSVGILGEYIGRIYEEVKARPLYTLAEVGGLYSRSPNSIHNADKLVEAPHLKRDEDS